MKAHPAAQARLRRGAGINPAPTSLPPCRGEACPHLAPKARHTAHLLGGLLSILVSVSNCAASPSEKELLAFARRAEKLIEQQHPDQSCRVLSKGAALECAGVSLGLENLRRIASRDGLDAGEVDALIREQFEAAMAAAAEDTGSLTLADADWETAKPRLRPQLVPAEYRQQVEELVAESFLPGIDVAWVLDEPERYVFVKNEAVERWQISREELKHQALTTLARASAGVEVTAERPQDPDLEGRYLTIAEGDSYDAARALLPSFLERFAELLGETYFLALPNRDFLVAWSRDYAFHEEFAEKVAEDFEAMHHPLSPSPFIGTAKGLRQATVIEVTRLRLEWTDEKDE